MHFRSAKRKSSADLIDRLDLQGICTPMRLIIHNSRCDPQVLRRAFDQALILEEHRYFEKGIVGLDVKVMRTQQSEVAHKHLQNSMATFLCLIERVRSLDRTRSAELIAARDYEELDALVLNHLLGR